MEKRKIVNQSYENWSTRPLPWAVTTRLALTIHNWDPVLAIENGWENTGTSPQLDIDTYMKIVNGELNLVYANGNPVPWFPLTQEERDAAMEGSLND